MKCNRHLNLNWFHLVLVMGLSFKSLACDVCGCGANSAAQGLGTLAQGNRTSIGLNYQYRIYKSEHPMLFSDGMERSTDLFHRWDLLGQIRLAKRWQMQIVVPFTYNTHETADTLTQKGGLADPTLTVNFFLFNREDSIKRSLFRWIAGVGLKSPVGKFTKPNDEDLFLYPGTGSFDVLFQSSLIYQKGRWGLQQSSQYILRGENKYNYIPGSLLTANLYGQYKWRNWGIFVGSQFNWSGSDYLNRKTVANSPTQGKILTGIIGGTVQIKQWVLQGNIHLPLAQKLGEGYSQQKIALTCSINYFFN